MKDWDRLAVGRGCLGGAFSVQSISTTSSGACFVTGQSWDPFFVVYREPTRRASVPPTPFVLLLFSFLINRFDFVRIAPAAHGAKEACLSRTSFGMRVCLLLLFFSSSFALPYATDGRSVSIFLRQHYLLFSRAHIHTAVAGLILWLCER